MGFLRRLLTFYFILISSASGISIASDTLRKNQVLEDGQTLVSSNQRFELGFFIAGSSNNTYLGLWYKNMRQTIVWVANRNRPISGPTGRLSLTSNGFAVSDTNSSVEVLSVNSTEAMTEPVLRLLNNGNLVFRDESIGDSEDHLWQSFDHITDNLLPEMKLGWSLKSGLQTSMTSWASDDDPSQGQFTFSLDSPETPQLVLTRGAEKEYRWGPWDGVRFSGNKELKPNPVFSPSFNSTRDEIFYTFRENDESTLSRFAVTQQGSIQYLVWSETNADWSTMVSLQGDNCDAYSYCGPYGICYASPICKCLKGFQPKSPEQWKSILWSSGCERKWNLSCGDGDGFVKYEALKLPDKSYLAANRSLTSVKECEAECLRNCSCTAYAWLNIHNTGGDCVLWSGDLVDMRNFPDGGEDLYIRMARQELKAISDAKKRKNLKLGLFIATLSVVVAILVCVLGLLVVRRKNTKRENGMAVRYIAQFADLMKLIKQETQEDLELPLFDLSVIFAATKEFSFENKIGEGGFGPVYKGVLPSGQEIAVKRLSQHSGQGILEFKNEVILIEKLQHRNLVKLLGCCIEGEERMLVYEYLPNSSLNYILFDPNRQKQLPWKKRFDIIMGIARGLLYLHQDSRLRIIHRDLKASNVLLDIEMNPKISDFGIARIFGGERTQEKTKRVIGTYGYMSPEYAMSGYFSVKSDVFSFGVLVLEIVSGKKNWGFNHPDHDLNLLGHAWKLWNEGKPLELMDKQMGAQFSENEVARCIRVGLLCVQKRVEDRPTMSSVLFMLGNESSVVPESLPEPKEPGFVSEGPVFGADTSSSRKNPLHTSNLTITVLDGR